MAYTSYESFYGGGYSSLDPKFGEYFAGYRMNAAQVGFPGSPSTANQLGETVNALKQGVKAFEVSLLGIQGDPDQTIPKQHFKEMKALMKLSGVKPSVHGPVVDAAGFSDRGWGGETTREDNERRMFDAIEKAHELDDKGNIPIVFHSTNGIPGNEYAKDEKGEVRVTKIGAINQESPDRGLQFFEEERRFYPTDPDSLVGKDGNEPEGIFHPAVDQINSANATEWENKMTELATFNKHADEVIGGAKFVLAGYEKGAINPKTNEIVQLDSKGRKIGELPPLTEYQVEAFHKMKDADIFLKNVELNFNGAFNKAFKYSNSDEQTDKLVELSKNYTKAMSDIEKNGAIKIFAPIEKRQVLDNAINTLHEITNPRKQDSDGKFFKDSRYDVPKVFKPVEEFAIDKTIETFSNLAMRSYNKFQEKAPVIAIENMYQGMAFSRAEDLEKIVKETREKFKEYLMEKKGFSEKKAEKLAEEKIGVTWDVGHLNLMKKRGFVDEDIRKETEKITPYVKHIHLTDNFGFADSHLPPGMGNVPIKDILLELEKNGKFKEMRKIVEAGNFVQHFKKSPHPYSLSVIGSPIYGMSTPVYWNQVQDNVGNYFGGYGTINPQTHHSLYGAGFTMLPTELGGQMPGAQNQSRFGGTPMA